MEHNKGVVSVVYPGSHKWKTLYIPYKNNVLLTMASLNFSRLTLRVFTEHSISTATPQQSTLSWQPGMDSCGSSMAQQQVEPAQHSSATMDSTKGHKESEDVELMSSDTSSSSSSDE